MNLLSYFHVKWQIVNQIRTFFHIGHVMQIHGNMAQIPSVHVAFFAFGIVTDGQLFSLVAKGGINAPRMRDFYLHSLVADQRNPEDKLFTNHPTKVQNFCLFTISKEIYEYFLVNLNENFSWNRLRK